MPANSSRLANAVERWMREKSLTQAVIAGRSGPSTTSMTKILSGEGNLQSVILQRLDAGLNWGDGMAAQILSGGSTPWDDAPADFDWRTVTDAELLAELGERLSRKGTTWRSGNQRGPEDDAQDQGGDVAEVADLDHRRRRLIEQSQPVTSAAYEGEDQP